jgi:hypothetical protein
MLYDGYVDGFDAIREDHLDPLAKHARASWKLGGEDGRISGPSVEDLEKRFDMRRRAIAAIRALDASLFDDIALSVVPDDDDDRIAAMTRIRRARDRVVFAQGRVGISLFSRSGSRNPVDLVAVAEAALDPEPLLAVDPMLAEYEGDFVNMLELRFERMIVFDQGRTMLEATAVTSEGRRDWRVYGAEFRRLRETLGAPLTSVESDIRELNAATLGSLAARLDDGGVRAFDRAYQRARHPEVFADPEGLESVLRDALALDDLTGDQRRRLGELIAEHQSMYEDLCEQMVAVRESLETSGRDRGRGGGGGNEMERLRFERRELNDKGRRRLRSIMSDEQASRLGIAEVG